MSGPSMGDRVYRISPVTTRSLSLHATLVRLAQDLAEAVLDAVRAASMSELAVVIHPRDARRTPGRLRSPTSATARSIAAPSDTVRTTRARRARATPIRREPVSLAEAVDLTEAYPNVAIIDPASVLAAVDQSTSRPEIVSTPTDDAVVAPAPEEARAPAARTGEDVLRSAGGEAVLRRRRSPRTSDVPGGATP